MSDSILQVNKIKDKGGNATGITVADTSANVTINNLTATTASVPATTSACVKLYANDASGVASVSVDGLFDDTKYGHYEMHLNNVRISSADTGLELILRGNLSGTATDGSVYWTAAGGNYNNDGTAGAFDRADNDGGTYAYMDNTWSLANSGQTSRHANYILKFANPQSANKYKLFYVVSYGNGHENSTSYDAWVDNKVISIDTNTALTGLTFLMNGSTSAILHAEILLVGFRK